jgi:putative SOS response-associated peptidase YedK
MCGRFQISKVIDEVQIRFHIDVEKEWYRQIFNVGPMMSVPVITNEEPERMNFFRWGLVPFWAKDASIGNKLINARAESIGEKPAFKNALKKRRCLVPADGFYEWKRTGPIKQPYRICRKDEGLFAFAGLWETWKDAEGKELQTFTIITTTPNQVVSGIHDRMPVILRPEFETLWLDSQVSVDEAMSYLQPYPAEDMKAYPVSSQVNSVRNNSVELLNPVLVDQNLELF